MVWLVVTVNGVFYLGKNLKYITMQKKRYAQMLECTMYNRRWDPVFYHSAFVHLRYVIFAKKIKKSKFEDFNQLLKWFKGFPESERIR